MSRKQHRPSQVAQNFITASRSKQLSRGGFKGMEAHREAASLTTQLCYNALATAPRSVERRLFWPLKASTV